MAVFTAVHVREWVVEHISGGIVERVLIAGNAPLPYFKANVRRVDEGLSVDIETSGTTLRLSRVCPRSATPISRRTSPAARQCQSRAWHRRNNAWGTQAQYRQRRFRNTDTHLKPSPARARFRIDGSVPAAAELLAGDALRQSVGIVLDPASSRGTIAAQVIIDMRSGAGFRLMPGLIPSPRI